VAGGSEPSSELQRSATVVVDASAVVAALVAADGAAERVRHRLETSHCCAPALLGFEAAQALRSLQHRGRLSPAAATQAHADLLALPIDLWPYEVLAARAWALRANVTVYDATYLALGELLDAPLVTLDRRLARVRASRCRVEVA